MSTNNFTTKDSLIRFVTSEKDIDAIAFLHKNPEERELEKHLYRFYRDKVKLFLEFDPQSVLIASVDGKLAGFLIYTDDVASFTHFAGLAHLRFYVVLLKTILGYYGYDFKKYFLVFRSIFGKNKNIVMHAQVEAVNYGKIWALVVAPEFRRMGLAIKLINTCLSNFKAKGGSVMRITVRKNNVSAIKAYEKSGFRIIGECEESTGICHVMEINP